MASGRLCDGFVDKGAPACVYTMAGNGQAGAQEGQTTRAMMHSPYGMALHSRTGTLYIADTDNNRVLQMDSQGQVTTLGDCPPAPSPCPAEMRSPLGVAVDTSDLVCVSTMSHRILCWDPLQQTWEVFAGSGGMGLRDGAAQEAVFKVPSRLVFDGAGNLIVLDAGNYAIRRIDRHNRRVSTLLGGRAGDRDGAASQALLRAPLDIALDSKNRYLYIADAGAHKIKRYDLLQRKVITLTGQKKGHKDGTLQESRWEQPQALVLAGDILYVAEYPCRVRKMDLKQGTVSTIYQQGASQGYQDGPISRALFRSMSALLLLPSGDLAVLDTKNHALRAWKLP